MPRSDNTVDHRVCRDASVEDSGPDSDAVVARARVSSPRQLVTKKRRPAVKVCLWHLQCSFILQPHPVAFSSSTVYHVSQQHNTAAIVLKFTHLTIQAASHMGKSRLQPNDIVIWTDNLGMKYNIFTWLNARPIGPQFFRKHRKSHGANYYLELRPPPTPPPPRLGSRCGAGGVGGGGGGGKGVSHP